MSIPPEYIEKQSEEERKIEFFNTKVKAYINKNNEVKKLRVRRNERIGHRQQLEERLELASIKGKEVLEKEIEEINKRIDEIDVEIKKEKEERNSLRPEIRKAFLDLIKINKNLIPPSEQDSYSKFQEKLEKDFNNPSRAPKISNLQIMGKFLIEEIETRNALANKLDDIQEELKKIKESPGEQNRTAYLEAQEKSVKEILKHVGKISQEFKSFKELLLEIHQKQSKEIGKIVLESPKAKEKILDGELVGLAESGFGELSRFIKIERAKHDSATHAAIERQNETINEILEVIKKLKEQRIQLLTENKPSEVMGIDIRIEEEAKKLKGAQKDLADKRDKVENLTTGQYYLRAIGGFLTSLIKEPMKVVGKNLEEGLNDIGNGINNILNGRGGKRQIGAGIFKFLSTTAIAGGIGTGLYFGLAAVGIALSVGLLANPFTLAAFVALGVVVGGAFAAAKLSTKVSGLLDRIFKKEKDELVPSTLLEKVTGKELASKISNYFENTRDKIQGLINDNRTPEEQKKIHMMARSILDSHLEKIQSLNDPKDPIVYKNEKEKLEKYFENYCKDMEKVQRLIQSDAIGKNLTDELNVENLDSQDELKVENIDRIRQSKRQTDEKVFEAYHFAVSIGQSHLTKIRQSLPSLSNPKSPDNAGPILISPDKAADNPKRKGIRQFKSRTPSPDATPSAAMMPDDKELKDKKDNKPIRRPTYTPQADHLLFLPLLLLPITLLMQGLGEVLPLKICYFA